MSVGLMSLVMNIRYGKKLQYPTQFSFLRNAIRDESEKNYIQDLILILDIKMYSCVCESRKNLKFHPRHNKLSSAQIKKENIVRSILRQNLRLLHKTITTFNTTFHFLCPLSTNPGQIYSKLCNCIIHIFKNYNNLTNSSPDVSCWTIPHFLRNAACSIGLFHNQSLTS